MGSRPRPFSFEFSRNGRAVTVTVRGEVDRQSSDVLRRLLLDVVEGQGNLSVALDLSEMTFIDSSGLSMLLEIHGRAVERGGSFMLQNPRPATSRIFEIVGLNRLVESA